MSKGSVARRSRVNLDIDECSCILVPKLLKSGSCTVPFHCRQVGHATMEVSKRWVSREYLVFRDQVCVLNVLKHEEICDARDFTTCYEIFATQIGTHLL